MTVEVEAEASEIQGHSQLQNDFEAGLGYKRPASKQQHLKLKQYKTKILTSKYVTLRNLGRKIFN